MTSWIDLNIMFVTGVVIVGVSDNRVLGVRARDIEIVGSVISSLEFISMFSHFE